MGITVHYSWTLPRGREGEITELLAGLATAARKARFAEVFEPVHLTGAACDHEHPSNPELLWARIQACRYERVPGLPMSQAKRQVPEEIHLVRSVPGPGCEEASFGLRRFSSGGWDWSSRCKTEYAGLPEHGGTDHFVRTHLALIEVLTFVKRRHLPIQVDDEGGYWGTKDGLRLVENFLASRFVTSAT